MLSTHLRRPGVDPWSLQKTRGAAGGAPGGGLIERRQRVVLPYLGGDFVWAPARRYRVLGRPAVGWHRFWVEGGEATAVEPAGPEGLEGLPQVRGYLVGPWLFQGGARAARLHLMPEQFIELTPCLARRLPGGALVFEAEALAEEHEARAIEALDDGLPCPAPAASLRAAYGFALLWRLCRRLGIPATPWGLRDQLARVAGGGKQGAFDLLAPCVSLAPLHGVDEVPPGGDDEALLGPVLAASGAALLGSRRLGDDLVEARFRFLDRAFTCVLLRSTLRVIDAGLCVDGTDGQLTLACLPSVLREAIAAGKVVLSRR